MSKEVTLTDSDRTVFAVCPNCNKTGKGRLAANFYSMAYTKRQWAREPKCENCETVMQQRYEVQVDE